jgi:hypothetical protein
MTDFSFPEKAAKAGSGSMLTLMAGVVALAAFQIYAFHWGVITPDSVFQFGQALSGQYDDWHPPITAWLWRQIMAIHSGSAGILFFQIGIYWVGTGLIARYFLDRGRRLQALLTILMAALPIPFGQMGAILKDPLLAALCLLASGLILARPDKPLLAGIIALGALVVATATRFNAVFATAPLAVALLPEPWTRSIQRVAISGALIVLFLVATTWCINVAALRPHKSEPIFSLVNFDLGGIGAHHGGNAFPSLSDTEAERATRTCYSAQLYNPANTDPCNAIEDGLRTWAHAHGTGALAIWLAGISRAPLAYLSHRLAHLNWNWRFLVPRVPDDAVYVMSEPNPFGLRFSPNEATGVVLAGARWMAWSPLGRPATWIAVALGLILIAPRLRNRRIVFALAASALCYGSGYALISVAPDMRYNLWTMLAAMLALIFASADLRDLPAGVAGRLIARALLPASIVMSAELVWLIFALPALA